MEQHTTEESHPLSPAIAAVDQVPPSPPKAQGHHVHGPGCSHHHHVETFVRGQPKPGRNDPCPCGSGKKSKKCCH